MKTRVVYCPWNRNNPYALERSDDESQMGSARQWTTFATMDNQEDAMVAARAYLTYPSVVAEFSASDAAPSALPAAQS